MNYNVNSDYMIEGIKILLNENCISERYFPLIQYKEQLISNLQAMGYPTKNACCELSDEVLIKASLPDSDMANLFRCFLCLYDYKGKGIKDIANAESRNEDEISCLLELMRLPGVKKIRAALYFHCGLKSVADVAVADAEQLRSRIASIIIQESLPFSPPLPKEMRTQIAVARVFTEYAVKRMPINSDLRNTLYRHNLYDSSSNTYPKNSTTSYITAKLIIIRYMDVLSEKFRTFAVSGVFGPQKPRSKYLHFRGCHRWFLGVAWDLNSYILDSYKKVNRERQRALIL